MLNRRPGLACEPPGSDTACDGNMLKRLWDEPGDRTPVALPSAVEASVSALGMFTVRDDWRIGDPKFMLNRRDEPPGELVSAGAAPASVLSRFEPTRCSQLTPVCIETDKRRDGFASGSSAALAATIAEALAGEVQSAACPGRI